MVGEQSKYLDYNQLVKKLKNEFGIEIEKNIIVPAINGRKQKKKTHYAKVIDFSLQQSGEIIVIVKQKNKKLHFTLTELKKCWNKWSSTLPSVPRGSVPT